MAWRSPFCDTPLRQLKNLAWCRLIRPESYINQYIDEDWVPLLQTPPFPEYTSGHSVISSSASVALTKLFGDNFAFTDSTETEFGLPPRQL